MVAMTGDGEARVGELWLVDGFNLLHACILRGRDRNEFWRPERKLEVISFVEGFGEANEVHVVFDGVDPGDSCGEPSPSLLPGTCGQPVAAGRHRCQVHHAPDADRAIIELCRQHRLQRQVSVVTADRSLQDRCRALGARPVRPWDFAAMLAQRQ